MHSKRHRRMFILSLPRSRLVLQIGIDKLPSTGVSRIPIQLACKILMYAEDLMTQYRNHHSLHGSISSQTCAQLDNSTRLSEAGFFFFFVFSQLTQSTMYFCLGLDIITTGTST